MEFDLIKLPSLLYNTEASIFIYIAKKISYSVSAFSIGTSKNMDDLYELHKSWWNEEFANKVREVVKSSEIKDAIRGIFK